MLASQARGASSILVSRTIVASNGSFSYNRPQELMENPKGFFHDRMILLLLSVSTFLTILGSILVLLRLDGSRTNGYIVQYRANLGISAFKTGGVLDMVSFIAFMILILVVNLVLSMRVYHLRRQLSVIILAFGVLLLGLAIVVSNALLILR